MSKDVFAPSRRLKRNYYTKRLLGAIFILGILFGTIVGFFHISYFSISSISIEGLKTTKKDKVDSSIAAFLDNTIWGVIPYSNFFILSWRKHDLVSFISTNFPALKVIEVKKNLPAAISLVVKERSIWATLCSEFKNGIDNTRCYYIDNTGFIFEQASTISGTVFFQIKDRRNIGYKLGDFVMPDDELKKIVFLKERIEKVIHEKIRAITIEGGELLFYEFITHSEKRIIFDARTRVDLAADNFTNIYQNLLKEKWNDTEYVDLRLENKVFYKLK